MSKWHLLIRHHTDEHWVDTGQTCETTDWPAAVHQFLIDQLAPLGIQALDLIDDIDRHGGHDTALRLGSAVYKVVAAAPNDLTHLARMARLVEQQAREVIDRLADDGAVGS